MTERPTTVAAVVLAAGGGRRYGMPKALVEYEGSLLFERAERTARARGIRLPREADVLRDALVAAGIPPNAIVIGGGSVDNTLRREDAVTLVDRVAPAYPEWEPDALLAALQ